MLTPRHFIALASKVRAGEALFGDGDENIGEVVSVSVDPARISFAKISEDPSRLSTLSAFSPGTSVVLNMYPSHC